MPSKQERTLTPAQSNYSAIPQPLRFYDPELQEALNAEPFDSSRYEKARQNARALHQAYLKQMKVLEPRLSKKAYRMFADPTQPLFDSDLLEFAFGDSVGVSPKSSRRNRLRLSIRAVFRSFDENLLHKLSYRKVTSLHANIPVERWFDSGDGRIDSLLADELVGLSGSLLEHTFLFVSGARITVQFGSVGWETTRALQKKAR